METVNLKSSSKPDNPQVTSCINIYSENIVHKQKNNSNFANCTDKTLLHNTNTTFTYMTTDRQFMMRCLQLAQMAEGNTTPNPMVGAVIVYQGRIIGEGYHHQAGRPHAEPNAIASVADKSLLARSTLYVSLEPCAHWGKTPPCAQLIADRKIPRVVVATLDPNPKVAGKGIEIMRRAGIEVTIGTLENEARQLNRRFITVHEKQRPYVILKWAQTADQFIDICRTTPCGGPVKISNSITKTLNHQIRTTEDAIMVATTTAMLDDPHLTVTKWSGKNPLRVLLDRTCRIPASARIFDQAAKTLIFTSAEGYARRTATTGNIIYRIVTFDDTLPQQIFTSLAELGINSIIIEGGAKWLQTVIDSGMWDEARIETAPSFLHNGVKSPEISGSIVKTEYFKDNVITHLIPVK